MYVLLVQIDFLNFHNNNIKRTVASLFLNVVDSIVIGVDVFWTYIAPPCVARNPSKVDFLIENEEFLNSIDKILIELHGFFKEHQKKGGTDKYNQKCIDILYSYGFCLKDNILHNYYFEKDEADPK